MAGISNTYDPATTAQAMAESFTAARQSMLTRQSAVASATEKGLSTLGSALSSFQTSLAALTGLNRTMSANSAVFSDTSAASAGATAAAAAGTYAFFVEQVASAHKVSFGGVADFAGGGELTLGVGAASFKVDLGAKANWTVRDLAAAINGASGNTSLSASVVTTGATSELVLSSTATGAANLITINTGAGTDATLASKLGSTPNQLSTPLDAVLRIGSASGTPITQSTNTFNVIDGVSITVAKAQAAGSAPVTLTVAADASKTAANVQAFIDTYNKLKSTLDALVNPGDPSSGSASGAFAGDSGVRALRDRMVSALRGAGTSSLANFGIIATREGTLTLDSTRMNKALALNPTGLDTLIGTSASTAPSGIAGQIDSYLKLWTNSVNGQIGSRKDAVGKLQADLTQRQTTLDKQYDSAYARYLAQFTKLQTVQSSMSYNTSLFDALFTNSKD